MISISLIFISKIERYIGVLHLMAEVSWNEKCSIICIRILRDKNRKLCAEDEKKNIKVVCKMEED
jgi:hypothetical protein